MTDVVRFEPIDVQPGELLQRGFAERPALILSEEHPEVYLGRGMKTGIDDLSVHQKMAKLCWLPSTAKVVLQIGSSRGEKNYSTALSVNGELPQWKHHPMIGGGMIVELKDGDVIAVEGSGDPTPILYQYQVVMSTSDSDSAAHHIEDDPPAIITASIPSPFKALGDETMCPVCMDIQVQSHFFVPCGHSFCHDCVSPSPATCSICRVPVQKQTPNLVLDNMIWKMIEIQTATTGASSYHYYDDDDIQQYLLRSGKTLPSKTTHHQTTATTSPPPRHGRRQAIKTEDLVGLGGTPSSVQRKRKRIHPEDSQDQIIGSFQGRSRESAICID